MQINPEICEWILLSAQGVRTGATDDWRAMLTHGFRSSAGPMAVAHSMGMLPSLETTIAVRADMMDPSYPQTCWRIANILRGARARSSNCLQLGGYQQRQRRGSSRTKQWRHGPWLCVSVQHSGC